jgi:KDO2-lipid IV(A) lauroyltransferase
MSTLLRLILGWQAMLPLPVNQWLGRQLGFLNNVFGSRAAKVTRANLELCLPEYPPAALKKLASESMRHTGMTALETPSVWLSDPKRKDAWLGKIENEHLLDAAMTSASGTLILLPHLGNWEMFNAYFARRGRMTALYQPPRQEWLKPFMETIRGDNLVATNRQGLTMLYKELSAGRVVTVLPDQVPLSGEYVPFFGQAALTDRLVPRLLAKTGARALLCVVYRAEGKFNVCFGEPDPDIYNQDLITALTALNRSVETSITPFLAQYQWEYKRFRERPTGEKKLYKFDRQPDSYH